MQINARAPIGRFINKDSNVPNPMPWNTIDPNVVIAPDSVVDVMERTMIAQIDLVIQQGFFQLVKLEGLVFGTSIIGANSLQE